MRRLGVVLLLGLCGCAKPPPKKVEAPKAVDPQEAVKKLMADVYAAVQAGEADKLEEHFTADAMVFGLGPSDTFNFRDTLIDRARQELLPLGLGGDKLEISDSRVTVGLGKGETSAWLYDLPKVTATHKGEDSTWLPRITGHAVKDGDRWRLDALHLSLAVSDALLAKPDASRLLLAPTPVTDERGPDADQLVGLTRRLVEDMGVKVDRASERPGFVLVGTSPVELFEGGKAFKDLVRPQLSAIKKGGYTWKLEGPLRVRLAPDHQSGWAAGVLVMRIGGGKKAQTYPPFRALWLFADEGGVWNLVSEHQSLAVKVDLREPADQEQLKAWKALREAAEKRAASEAKKPPPDKPRAKGKENVAAPIEAW
ncbi:MAG: nuclear transport factor 2 family protein [Myxococcota bacterium]